MWHHNESFSNPIIPLHPVVSRIKFRPWPQTDRFSNATPLPTLCVRGSLCAEFSTQKFGGRWTRKQRNTSKYLVLYEFRMLIYDVMQSICNGINDGSSNCGWLLLYQYRLLWHWSILHPAFSYFSEATCQTLFLLTGFFVMTAPCDTPTSLNYLYSSCLMRHQFNLQYSKFPPWYAAKS